MVGFVPGIPEIELDPELVLLIFLPPLLYGAAFFTSLPGPAPQRAADRAAVDRDGHGHDGRRCGRGPPRGRAGLGPAFVLGAIVSPTDAVAPAEIMRRVGAPRRLLTVVEGENLTNDWTALVLYRVAVAAVVTGTFSLGEASFEFVLSGVGGLAVGLVAGRIIRELRRRLDDPPTEIDLDPERLRGYLPAEELGFSGVIAAVTVRDLHGLARAHHRAVMRMQGVSVWEISPSC